LSPIRRAICPRERTTHTRARSPGPARPGAGLLALASLLPEKLFCPLFFSSLQLPSANPTCLQLEPTISEFFPPMLKNQLGNLKNEIFSRLCFERAGNSIRLNEPKNVFALNVCVPSFVCLACSAVRLAEYFQWGGLFYLVDMSINVSE
jgi:hypothetical protein